VKLLDDDRRRALALMAGSRGGITEAIFLAYGYKADLLASLVSEGLAEVVTDTIRAGAKTIEVKRLQITDAGTTALKGPRRSAMLASAMMPRR